MTNALSVIKQAFSLAYLGIGIVIFLFLYVRAGKKYKAMIDPLPKSDYGLKDFFSIGFAFMDLIHYQYNSNFDRKLLREFCELFEPDYAHYYLRVYWAGAVTYIVLALIISGMLNLGIGPMGLVFGLGVGAAMVYAWFYSLEEKIKERHEKILIDMPDFTNKILILTGAGMTLRAALIKISDEMSNDTVLYQTLAKCVQMMRNGITDEKALDYMTIQCNTPQMRRFISVVLQNMKRGGTDVIAALQDIGREQWEERKAAAKRLCAEADSKLLFPMMLMLFSVVLMTVTPALSQITNAM